MSKYTSEINGHALVLGGSGGIGREIIRTLVANGTRAISFTYGKNERVAKSLARELKKKRVKVYCAPLDIRDESAIKKFLAEAVATVGQEVAAAVNTIAYSPNTPLSRQTPEEWRKVNDINVIGNFLAGRAIAERMKARKIKGSIVFLSSDNAELSWDPKSAPYDCSKMAVSGMRRHFAEQYAKSGIRFNVIEPGWTDTALNDTVSRSEIRKAVSRTLLERFARPEEIAQMVVAVLVDTFMNAAVVRVNGGFR